jgi:hypothetical protein
MQKLLLTLFLLTAGVSATFAGSGGPDAYGYTWRDNLEPNGPTFAWYDITTIGTQIFGLGDDNVVGPFGFISGFQFYWYTTEQIWVGSNGYLGFSGANIASPFPTIPSTVAPNNFLAVMMSDLIFGSPGSNAQAFYHVTGDTICVSWINAPFWNVTTGFTGSNTFQVILNKADKSITYNYQGQSGITNANDITIGIENVSGGVGLQHSKNIYPVAGRSIKFYYPAVVTYQAVDGGVNWNMDEGNGGVFVNKNVPAVLKTNIRNFGNQPLNNINVSSSVSFLGVSAVTNTGAVSALTPGGDSLISFSNLLTPLNDGIYNMTTTISGITGDLVPANNTLQTKIIAVDSTSPAVIFDYSDGGLNGTGLSWSGGSGGIGYYIQPSFYPAKINAYQMWIITNAAATGCYLKVFDDNGPNGGPGTLLDSTFAAPASIVMGGYSTIPLRNTNLIVQGGGFYILWEMPGGADLTLARDTDLPISYRAMEYLGGSWASYRARSTEDFLFGVQAQQFLVRDLELVNVIQPTPGSTINTPTSPQVVVKNIGNLVNNVTAISYRFAGLPAVNENILPNTLQPGDSVSYTFSVPLSSPITQTGSLCIWVSMNGDITRTNDTICMQITYDAATSVSENALNPIKLYPNPAYDRVTLDFGELTGKGKLQLFDMQGKLMREVQLNLDGTYELTLEGLPTGLFQYVLQTENNYYRGRLMKARP